MRRVALLLLVLVALSCEYENKFHFGSAIYGDAAPTALAAVPAGWFVMGSPYDPGWPDAEPDQPFSDEHPQHDVYLDAFWVEIREVTNARFRACVGAGACEDATGDAPIDVPDYYTNPAYDDYPVIGVTWAMADDYCQWRGRRLPTEAEWEKAARGSDDDRSYPWGWQEPTCGLANISIPDFPSDGADESAVETCHGLPVAVGYYPQAGSPCGATETAGNVAEWVADFYAADYYDRAVWPDNEQNPTGPAEGERRVTRGGSFATTAVFARVSYREPRSPDYSSVDLGFRCVSDAAE